jgi:hypothetical protein
MSVKKILQVKDLPWDMQLLVRRIKNNLIQNNTDEARKCFRDLLKFYVEEEREIPPEVEELYATLLIQENEEESCKR